MKTNDTQKNKRVYVNIKIKVELIYVNSFFFFLDFNDNCNIDR